jgi:hypothetical protein
MIHAQIRTAHDAMHFFAEVNPYNLQTLRQHVKQRLHDDGPLTISLQIDPSDERAFTRYTSSWLPALIEAGTAVELDIATNLDRPFATPAATGTIHR